MTWNHVFVIIFLNEWNKEEIVYWKKIIWLYFSKKEFIWEGYKVDIIDQKRNEHFFWPLNKLIYHCTTNCCQIDASKSLLSGSFVNSVILAWWLSFWCHASAQIVDEAGVLWRLAPDIQDGFFISHFNWIGPSGISLFHGLSMRPGWVSSQHSGLK